MIKPQTKFRTLNSITRIPLYYELENTLDRSIFVPLFLNYRGSSSSPSGNVSLPVIRPLVGFSRRIPLHEGVPFLSPGPWLPMRNPRTRGCVIIAATFTLPEFPAGCSISRRINGELEGEESERS